jgi:glycosyltransferase involved in cell wall biosynthesis
LRIWHILETYPPDYGGGAAITTRDVCRSLAVRGHEVRVLCTEKADRPAYTVRVEQDEGVQVERVNLPYFRTTDPEGWQLGWRAWHAHERKIDRLIGERLAGWRPDLADYHTARPLGEQCLLTLRQQGVPVIATLHDAWLVCPRVMLLRSPQADACPGPAPLRCLECLYSHYDGGHARALLKLPWRLLKLNGFPAYRLRRRARACGVLAGAVARSEFMARVHRPWVRGPVRHIPLGIDLEGRPADRAARPRNPLRFGFLAGFQATKGIDHVLDAAASLRRSRLPFELHVWGPGQEGQQAQLVRRGLQDCTFLRGVYGPEQRWAVYGDMDVALMATLVAEPFGRIPMEAAAAGVPTIGPAVGGIAESIRDGVDGLLYRFRDAADLERQMRRVAEDPGLVVRLRANLRPALDVRTAVAEVERFYASVLSTPAGRRGSPVPFPEVMRT